jgi:hypothetical protein
VFLLFLCAPFLSLCCLQNYIQWRYALFACSVETAARCISVNGTEVAISVRIYDDNRSCFVENTKCGLITDIRVLYEMCTLPNLYFIFKIFMCLCMIWMYIWKIYDSDMMLFLEFSHVWKTEVCNFGTLRLYVKRLCIPSVLAFLCFSCWFI